MLNSAFQAVKKQKKFINGIAKEFVSRFISQTAKLVEIVKAREEKQKAIFLQLSAPLNKPKLQSFLNTN